MSMSTSPATCPPAPRRELHDGCPQPRPDWVPTGAGTGFATWLVEGVRPPAGGVVPRSRVRRRELSTDELVAGVLARDPMMLGRAITLMESHGTGRQQQAQAVLAQLLPHTGRARRIGITGIPGAGKSTFIEALGGFLIEAGLRVAVLAIDPSSTVHGGSILADKLRMEKLSRRPEAFIRPSPSGGAVGGVARKTREAMLVCEAAGFDVVIVETVGVGQNEVTVRSMVDLFLVLMIAGAGDEMQGIKKGVIELADAIVVNKADGENRGRCVAAQAEMQRVLHYLQPATRGWTTPAVLASALTGAGLDDTWAVADDFFTTGAASGELERRRRRQSIEWFHALLDELLRERFYAQPGMRQRLALVEDAVAAGRSPPLGAALALLENAADNKKPGD